VRRGAEDQSVGHRVWDCARAEGEVSVCSCEAKRTAPNAMIRASLVLAPSPFPSCFPSLAAMLILPASAMSSQRRTRAASPGRSP
jgi:hypothetical protein